MVNTDPHDVLISDLTCFQPHSAITRDLQKFTWRAVDYRTEMFSGVLLSAWPESQVPEIHYPFNVQGWYSIYLGLWIGDGIYIKLSGDKAAQWVASDTASSAPVMFEEIYWKQADLSGQSIIVRHPEGGTPFQSYLAFIRLVPLSREEVGHIWQDRARKDTRRLIAMNDMHGLFYADRPVNAIQLNDYIEPLRNTDFDKLYLEYWESGITGSTIQQGMLCSSESRIFLTEGDRNFVESRLILKSKGIDIYESMMAHAREMGLKVFLSMRANALASELPYDTMFTTDFYRENPQWRCRDKDGSEISMLSYAFEEVQDRLLSTFSKMASYGPDGIGILYNRHFPYVLYEKPLVQGFMEKEGVDPRVLDDSDERWLRYRSQIMTGFLRKLKEAMRVAAKDTGRNHIDISVHVLAHEQENLLWGLDVEAWVNEGLVNQVVAHPRVALAPNVKSSSSVDVVPIDVDYYARIVKDTECKLYIDMLPRQMEPEEYRRRANDYYDKGADGLCFWDTTTRYRRRWSTMAQLGHKDELKDMRERERFRHILVQSLGGCRVDRYPPSWGL